MLGSVEDLIVVSVEFDVIVFCYLEYFSVDVVV